MKITNIQNNSFGTKQYQRPKNRVVVHFDCANSSHNYAAPNKKASNRGYAIARSASLIASGLAVIMATWNSGYNAGYKAKVAETIPYVEYQDLSELYSPQETATVVPTLAPTIAPSVTSTPYIEEPVSDYTIPSSVVDISSGAQVYEIDLSSSPYLYRAEFGVPSYLIEKGIDEAKLASAQRNVARIFQDGDYIIISPKEDTTMGVIKDVFGIIDGVAGEDSANKLQQRQLIEGSNGNLDDAIIPAGDAIRIERYTTEHGHQIGVYEFHKSNKSRDKIAQTILDYAN